MPLLISSHEIKNKFFSFYSYIDNISNTTDLEKCRYRIANDLREIIRLTYDINTTSKVVVNFDEFIYTLNGYIHGINELESVEEIKNYISDDKEKIKDHIEILSRISDDLINSLHMRYNKDYFSKRYNPCNISPKILNAIVLSLNCTRDINVLYPECLDGENFAPFQEILDPINLYGVDVEDYLVDDAKQYTNNIAKGTLKGSRISNKAFDVLFLTPRITLYRDMSYDNKIMPENNEKYLLKNTLRYLRTDGVFIYTVPFYRISLDMWLYISKNISDISLIRHGGEQSKVTIIGYKKENIKDYINTFSYLKNLKYESIDDYMGYETTYNIPKSPIEIELFRGSVLDTKELTELVKTDGLYDDFFKADKKDNFKDNDRPLIPFNLGQIGLILTSGQLDGVIEEVNGIKHVIKGMIIKNEFEYDKDSGKDNVHTSVKTTCNVVQINVLDANGNLKTLI